VAAEGTAQDLAVQYFPLDLTDKASIAFVVTANPQVEPVDGFFNDASWDRSSRSSKTRRQFGTASLPSI
jgi:hypothetical protein